RPISPRPLGVQSVGDGLHANARLAMNEYGHRLNSGLRDLLAQLDQRRAVADEFIDRRRMTPQPGALGFQSTSHPDSAPAPSQELCQRLGNSKVTLGKELALAVQVKHTHGHPDLADGNA